MSISHNTGKSALPDIYTQHPRVHSALGQVRIYQAKHEYLFYTSGTLIICPNLKSTAQLAYIVSDADADCGRHFNVFITFPNVSMTCPIAVISIMGLQSH